MSDYSEIYENAKKIEQDTKEWLEWRQQGLGSSDASTVFLGKEGRSYFGDDWISLWDERVNGRRKTFSVFQKKAMQRGKDLEPRARELYERRALAIFPPALLIHKECSFLRASADGVNHELKKLIEIKCPGQKDITEALNGRVPDKYIYQCQWLMMVSGYDTLDYVTYIEDPEDIIVIPMKGDPVLQAKLLSSAQEFWGYVLRKEKPPVQDIEIHDPILKALLDEWRALFMKHKETESRIEALKRKIKAIIRSGSARCEKYKVQYIQKRGQVDYNKVPELFGVDLEPYRKDPVTSFNISLVEDKNEPMS